METFLDICFWQFGLGGAFIIGLVVHRDFDRIKPKKMLVVLFLLGPMWWVTAILIASFLGLGCLLTIGTKGFIGWLCK